MSGDVRILIVDDEPAVRDSLAYYLEDCDFDVLRAGTAEEGLTHLGDAAIDVALVDMRLPEMDGETFILKGHEKSPRTVFLVHTGSVNYSLSPGLKEIGLSLDSIFIKPVTDMDAFAEAIRTLAPPPEAG